MKKFLAIYLGAPTGMAEWQRLDDKTRKEKEREGVKGWKSWATENGRAIVDLGGPLGKTKRVARSGVSDTKNALAAYTIIEAASHEEASRLFLNHPHFTIFPGDSVEVMECLPIPKA